MSRKQTSGKTSARLVKQPHGGALLPGGTGAGGRPKDEWKAKLRELASSDSAIAGLTAIINDPTHPHYLKALEFAAERGYGKEAQTVEGDMRLTVVLRDE